MLRKWIQGVLDEDIGRGDITSAYIVQKAHRASASLISRGRGILSGINVFKMVYEELGVSLKWDFFHSDGDRLGEGDKICKFEGPALGIVVGERTALNILQQMSGIATYTDVLVQKISHTKARVVDTRKTIPGMRILSKYAVRTGGGVNHRFGLDDSVLIKDNHIAAAGGIREAVDRIRKLAPFTVGVEVEASCPREVQEALECKVDIIMLDNMEIDLMREMVQLIGNNALIEASGDINEHNITAVAETGVDFISVGALTHSCKAFNISLVLE
ncbi:MAG: carboxylating nicotinate-nucleotide diphosphorylase [Clostridia bacterium]|nr:carboxylating nicotinate-nucleotide diphosphorylase [Clostridia bacterium]